MTSTIPAEDARPPKLSEEEMNLLVERLAIALIMLAEQMASFEKKAADDVHTHS